ncbi:MAG: prepilin-type N-terminal cleavage/methylation domain-containing protein [Candidatus Omnitrophota bacterium]|jgi:prepilin-type N-terminal cleavage/methylation domain-containing protein|nr:MAG: prepilin-type N-terminal cleavage/methylation domain-containing protein [Candidatus Omnitrophota bacterium]
MRKDAFTLIELLIVVAIIGILAAIAVPNFMNAQVRAKVARTKGDLRAIGIALESYRVDRNNYPLGATGPDLTRDLRELTTPIAYISQVNLLDPFGGADRFDTARGGSSFGGEAQTSYKYFCFYIVPEKRSLTWAGRAGVAPENSLNGYLLYSFGPDKAQSALEWYASGAGNDKGMIYHPSNGLNSDGDIGITGGETRFNRGAEINNAL